MATSPFSIPTAGVSADNPLAPEYLALERQKKIADLLMQKGQELPQAQTVSGYYVPPSWTQQLGTLANAYMGGKMAEQNEAKTAKLAELLRGQNVTEAQDILNTIKTNPQEALIKSVGARGQFGQSLAPQLVSNMFKEETPLVLPEGATAVNRKGEVIASGTPKFHAPIQIDAGTHIELRDPITKKLIEKIPKTHVFAPHASQIMDTTTGMLEYNPNTKTMTPLLINGKPVMGNKSNLPEGATKQVTGIENVKSALDQYKKKLENFNAIDMLNPNKRTNLATDYQNTILQMKEAYALGVLNGNDYQILTSMLQDPRNPKSALVSKDEMLKQVDDVTKNMSQMQKNVYKTHNYPIPEYLNTPSLNNDLISNAQIELNKRKKVNND